MDTIAVLLVVLNFPVGVFAKLSLPPYILPCSIRDPKLLGDCAKQRANEVIPRLIDGDEAYGLRPLDPLFIDYLEMENEMGAVGFKLIATNVEIYGLRQVNVDNVTHSIEPQEDVFGVSIPNVHINCTYNITGHILVFPVIGYGRAVMTLKNVTAIYRSAWKLETLNDSDIYYLPALEADLNIETDSMSLYLDNLFNGDATLAGMTLNFINLNWGEVFNAMRPSFTKTFSKIINDVLQGIFSQVPYKDAFVDTDEVLIT